VDKPIQHVSIVDRSNLFMHSGMTIPHTNLASIDKVAVEQIRVPQRRQAVQLEDGEQIVQLTVQVTHHGEACVHFDRYDVGGTVDDNRGHACIRHCSTPCHCAPQLPIAYNQRVTYSVNSGLTMANTRSTSA